MKIENALKKLSKLREINKNETRLLSRGINYD